MKTEITITIFDLIVFLGVCQGLLLSWFFLRNSDTSRKANLYQGLFLLSLSLGIFEVLLNNTGYIVKVLLLSNFAEPLNFLFAPLFYLYIKRSLTSESSKRDWIHFLVFILYFVYCWFHFIQPEEVKYNSYVWSNHPDWPRLKTLSLIPEDPLNIRKYVNELTLIQFMVYLILIVTLLLKKSKNVGQSLFRLDDEQIKGLRNSSFHLLMIMTVFIFVKLYFGRDTGDYFIATYISFMIYTTSFQVLHKSSYFDQTRSFLDIPFPKYTKSSLTEENKEIILDKIKSEFIQNRYFTNNLASLSNLAKIVHESSNHVSQVINEKMNMSFFELLACYRIEEAKKLITSDRPPKLTVEEITEMVGYNSKTAFNNAFKKHTGQTPSEFRKLPTV